MTDPNDANVIIASATDTNDAKTSWSNYERFDGEVKLDGTIYKYVKRKLTNDTLHLMCIKNIRKMEYENAKSDFYKNSNDLFSGNNSQKSVSFF